MWPLSSRGYGLSGLAANKELFCGFPRLLYKMGNYFMDRQLVLLFSFLPYNFVSHEKSATFLKKNPQIKFYILLSMCFLRYVTSCSWFRNRNAVATTSSRGIRVHHQQQQSNSRQGYILWGNLMSMDSCREKNYK